MCRPGDSRLSHQRRKLEEGYRTGGAKEENKEGIHVQGRRVPVSHGEFQNLCDLNGEGIFTAQRGPWHKRRIFASREREFGDHCRVRNKIRISGGDQRSGSKVQVEVGVDADERSEKLVRNTDVVR